MICSMKKPLKSHHHLFNEKAIIFQQQQQQQRQQQHLSILQISIEIAAFSIEIRSK